MQTGVIVIPGSVGPLRSVGRSFCRNRSGVLGGVLFLMAAEHYRCTQLKADSLPRDSDDDERGPRPVAQGRARQGRCETEDG